ncbi:hypothetical protein Aduo_015079 [Ancylostoma duodenale]
MHYYLFFQKTPGQVIDHFIASKPIVVFSKTRCKYCKLAKAALDTFKLSPRQFEKVELDKLKDVDYRKIQDEFEVRYGTRTVPKVFIGGKFIGGGTDTIKMQKNGTLAVLVKKAIKSA